MNKFMRLLLLLTILIALFGCNQTSSYVYMHDQNDIESIDIIFVEEDNGVPVVTIVKSVDSKDFDEFIEELNQIKFQENLDDDYPTIYDKQAVMITYKNDDYEIITYDVQRIFYSVSGTYENRGFNTSKEIFDEWLMPYILSSKS